MKDASGLDDSKGVVQRGYDRVAQAYANFEEGLAYTFLVDGLDKGNRPNPAEGRFDGLFDLSLPIRDAFSLTNKEDLREKRKHLELATSQAEGIITGRFG